MNNDINKQFRAAGIEYVARRKAEREARETGKTGDIFAKHVESILAARREESGIEDLLG